MRYPLVLLAFVSFTAVAGCAKTDSSSLLTSGVSAGISVTADGTGTATVSAELFDGNPSGLDFVELQGDDALVASSSGTSKTLDRSEFLNIVSYAASFPGQGQEGATFTVAFQRKVDKGAPNSTCTIPSAFNLSSPAANASFSRAGSDIQVSWSPAGSSDSMSYQVNGDCVETITKSIQGDPGTITIPKASIQSKNQSQPGSCNINVAILRQRAGQLDPGYGKGGNIYGVQSRAVTVQSSP